MKITLNSDKHPFFFIGKILSLSMNDPGPKEIDITKISPQELNQIVYGIKSGAITSDESINLTTNYSTPNQVPIKQVVSENDTSLEKEVEDLKKLLAGSPALVKKNLIEIKSLRHLKKLLKLEQEDKARPIVINAIQSLLDYHTNKVSEAIGKEDVLATTVDNKKSILEGTRGLVNLDNLTDVVESEIEKITINPKEE